MVTCVVCVTSVYSFADLRRIGTRDHHESMCSY
jgi:hypothetical protein